MNFKWVGKLVLKLKVDRMLVPAQLERLKTGFGGKGLLQRHLLCVNEFQIKGIE